MMGIKKTGVTYPETLKSLVIKNLRLPSDIATDDDSLIVSNLKSAIDYLEDVLSISITAKTVTQQWGTDINKYVLKWQPTAITSIKINDGDDIKSQAQIVKDSVPSFFYLPVDVYPTAGDIVITCIYTCIAETPAPALEQLIIMLASMYYNNPEGLGVNDHKKIQILLNNYTNII